jgi:hypothetical protein
LASSINSGVQGEDSGHFTALGFWESINCGLITIVHAIFFNVNEGWSSGEIDDEVSLFGDWAGPFVEEFFVDWGVLLVQVHFKVERVVKGNIIFKFVSKSGDTQNVIN